MDDYHQKTTDCDKQDMVLTPVDEKPDQSADKNAMGLIVVNARPLLREDKEICIETKQTDELPPDLSDIDEIVSLGIKNDEVVLTHKKTSERKVQLDDIGMYESIKTSEVTLKGSKQSVLIILVVLAALTVVLAMAGGK